jgi:molybdenum cofactor biosynthesis protein MoaC
MRPMTERRLDQACSLVVIIIGEYLIPMQRKRRPQSSRRDAAVRIDESSRHGDLGGAREGAGIRACRAAGRSGMGCDDEQIDPSRRPRPARMVDVGGKPETGAQRHRHRRIRMSPAALAAVRDGSGPKGDVLAAARIAGIMAAKKTGELIPLCHPLALDAVTVDFAFEDDAVRATARASLTGAHRGRDGSADRRRASRC